MKGFVIGIVASAFWHCATASALPLEHRWSCATDEKHIAIEIFDTAWEESPWAFHGVAVVKIHRTGLGETSHAASATLAHSHFDEVYRTKESPKFVLYPAVVGRGEGAGRGTLRFQGTETPADLLEHDFTCHKLLPGRNG